MPRSLSSGFESAIFASTNDEATLICITIEEATLSDPIYLVANNENISRDVGSPPATETFIAFEFGVILPQDDGDTIGLLRVIFGAVDERVKVAILTAQDRPKVTLEAVSALDFDVVEVGPMIFFLDQAEVAGDRVTATAIDGKGLQNTYPAHVRSQQNVPGAY